MRLLLDEALKRDLTLENSTNVFGDKMLWKRMCDHVCCNETTVSGAATSYVRARQNASQKNRREGGVITQSRRGFCQKGGEGA